MCSTEAHIAESNNATFAFDFCYTDIVEMHCNALEI